MYIKVALVVTAPHINPAETKCLLVVNPAGNVAYVPFHSLNNDKSIQLASSLLKRYTGLEARIDGKGWVDLIQAPLIELDKQIIIPYGCMLPETVEISDDVRWISFIEIFSSKSQYVIENIELMIVSKIITSI